MEEIVPELDAILVIRLGALGDVANTLPAIVALREHLPTFRVGWVAEEPSNELVAAAGVAEEIFIFPRKRLAALIRRPWCWHAVIREFLAFTRTIRSRQFDCVLDFQGNLKSALIGLATGVRDRVGFARGHCREMNWLFNSILAAPVSARLPRVEKNAALAQVLAPDLRPKPPVFPLNEAEAKAVEEFLWQLTGKGPLVVLHPGTSRFGEFKRWPAERYGRLAAILRRELDARCVVSFGPGEGPLAQAVVSASDKAAAQAPELTIRGLIELLRRADLLVAGDTGPLHIAALLQRPVVAIYGPKDPVIYGPYGTPSEIVRAEVECSPCARRKCEHVRCIRAIQPEEVFAAARRLLNLARSS